MVASRLQRVFGSPMPLLRLVVLFALVVCAVACKREAEKFIPDGEGDGSVWVVDGPNGGRLYLCGTIHILREKDYPLAPAYEAAYANSNKLVLELPPGATSGPELAGRMSQLGMYSADTSLEANVSKETWEAVRKWTKKRGLEVSSMNRYRPWFMALLMTNLEYASLGAKAEMGVDTHFEKRAKEDGKPAEGLETAEFQIQLFASLSDKQQRELLEQTLAEISHVAEEYEKIVAAWKHGDLAALEEMMTRESERYPDLNELFVTARNLAWMGRLEQMLKNGERVMVLTGTLHFISDTGLVELMRKRGHRVRHYREVTDF